MMTVRAGIPWIPLEPVRLEDHGYDCGFSERYGS
jgi:hypothetical protein